MLRAPAPSPAYFHGDCSSLLAMPLLQRRSTVKITQGMTPERIRYPILTARAKPQVLLPAKAPKPISPGPGESSAHVPALQEGSARLQHGSGPSPAQELLNLQPLRLFFGQRGKLQPAHRSEHVAVGILPTPRTAVLQSYRHKHSPKSLFYSEAAIALLKYQKSTCYATLFPD